MNWQKKDWLDRATEPSRLGLSDRTLLVLIAVSAGFTIICGALFIGLAF